MCSLHQPVHAAERLSCAREAMMRTLRRQLPLARYERQRHERPGLKAWPWR
jgi:hypothetical protein